MLFVFISRLYLIFIKFGFGEKKFLELSLNEVLFVVVLIDLSLYLKYVFKFEYLKWYKRY